MKRVYRSKGVTGATMVKHWLERNDVKVLVKGADLVGLGGEIPFGDNWPSVWVDEADEEKALALVRAFEGPQLVHPRWDCPRCGEDNEPNFGSCWNCDTDRP